MSAYPSPVTVRRSQRSPAIDPLRLTVRAIYLVAGAAVAAAIYRGMLDVLGGPMPTAILTLILALMTFVVTSGVSRRP